MNIVASIFCLLLLAAAAAPAGDKKGNFTSSTVSYVSGNDSVSGYLSVPEGKGPFPALIVIHEWWGLVPWVKENAGRFASQGYVALAIDLYRGKSADNPDDAHELSRGVPEDRAERDLVAAAAYLKKRPDVDGKKIGSVGWCMGGGYSLRAAMTIRDLAGAVVCYGPLVTDSSAVAAIPCPILGIFGQEDKGITPQDVHEFQAAAKKAGKSVDATIYKGAGHAFMNPNNTKGYRKASAEDAWSKIDAFLARTLKK